MNPFRTFLLLICALASASAAETPLPLAAALESKQLVAEATGNGRDQLSLVLRNSSPSSVAVTIPAGLIAEGHGKPDRVIVLRKAEASVGPQSAVEVALPVAALSSKNAAATRPFVLTTASEPHLHSPARLSRRPTRCPPHHRPTRHLLPARGHDLRAVAAGPLRPVGRGRLRRPPSRTRQRSRRPSMCSGCSGNWLRRDHLLSPPTRSSSCAPCATRGAASRPCRSTVSASATAPSRPTWGNCSTPKRATTVPSAANAPSWKRRPVIFKARSHRQSAALRSSV